MVGFHEAGEVVAGSGSAHRGHRCFGARNTSRFDPAPSKNRDVSDIFVSYTSTDRDWAHWIALELRQLGHADHVHEWEIGPGQDVLAWMEARFAASDQVLCVVSEEYLKAPYSTLERNAAVWRAATQQRPDAVLFVVVRTCALPPLIAHFRRCELHGLSQDDARARLRAFLAAPAAPASVIFPGHAVGASNITSRVPRYFTGRGELMRMIEDRLRGPRVHTPIIALHGMRGVGKTVLAVAYALEHRQDYRMSFWVRAETPDTLRADLIDLGRRLGWVHDGAPRNGAVTDVLDGLAREGEGLLLIYDNAQDAKTIEGLLPPAGAAHVLITSNAHAWDDVAEPIDVAGWPPEVGSAYLMARTASAETAVAHTLSVALGGLPLAHEMAAAYCREFGLSLGTYLACFDTTPAELLDEADAAPAAYHGGLTAVRAFNLAIDTAARRHRAAEPLLVAAAMLPPEPIPLFIFRDGWPALAEELDEVLEGRGLEQGIAALRRLGLIQLESVQDERDPTILTESIRLHRLIRVAALRRRTGVAAEAIKRGLFAAVAAVYPDAAFRPEAWPACRRLDAHVDTLLAAADSGHGARFDIRLAQFLIHVGNYRQTALAAYQTVRPMFERAIAIFEVAAGPEHEYTGWAAASLANLLHAQGDFAAARPLFERDLAITEKVLGAEHPGTGTSLSNLAGLLQAQGDLAAARPLFERVLAIREKVLGAEHPDTAIGLNNLAVLLQDQGDRAAARPLFERALGIYETVLGAEHPDTATSLSNLAVLLQAQGDLAAARPLFERALAIREQVLGADHPYTAIGLNNLAVLLQAQGDLAAARPLFERALAIGEKVLGAEHPHTATSVNELANLLRDQGDLAAARPLFERAVGIYETVLGEDHPYTGVALRNLAAVRRAEGDAAAARGLFERALRIAVAAFGAADPRAAHVRNELALTLLILRETAAADALVAESARLLAQPVAIVSPGVAFVALLSAVQRGRPTADPLGRLKTLLLGPALPRAGGLPHRWRIADLLPRLTQDLPAPWPEDGV